MISSIADTSFQAIGPNSVSYLPGLICQLSTRFIPSPTLSSKGGEGEERSANFFTAPHWRRGSAPVLGRSSFPLGGGIEIFTAFRLFVRCCARGRAHSAVKI